MKTTRSRQSVESGTNKINNCKFFERKSYNYKLHLYEYKTAKSENIRISMCKYFTQNAQS